MKHILITTIAAVVLVGTVFADPIHDSGRNGDLAGTQAELDKGVHVDTKALKSAFEKQRETEANGAQYWT